MTRTVRLAVIAGDGIGPEVIAEAEKVLAVAAPTAGLTFERTAFSLGADRYLATGDVLPDDELAAIAEHDVILLGAVGGVPGDPRLAGAAIERGLLLKLRFALDQYVNLRPTRVVPGVVSPLADAGPIDFVIVREGTEGPYAGNGGRLRTATPHEVATEVSVNTAFGVERVVEHAFGLAERRSGRLTWVHKTNVLVHAGALWQRVVGEVAGRHPDVDVSYLHVDAATIALVDRPADFDVIVTDNLFGDILTDLAGAIGGGIGLAASGNIHPSDGFPSMFEPVHGSAPDIAGSGRADPTAAIGSVALMLEHLGAVDAARLVTDAIDADVARRSGPRTTVEIGDAIARRVAEAASDDVER